MTADTPTNNQGRCHICGEVRAATDLSVERHKTTIPGSNQKAVEEVIYCNDKAECTAAAPTFSFINAQPKGSALAARQKRGFGQ